MQHNSKFLMNYLYHLPWSTSCKQCDDLTFSYVMIKKSLTYSRMDSVPIFEPTATPDTNILKSRLLLTKRTNPGTSDSSLTLQEKDPSDSSDLMFVSAISQPSGTTSAEEEGTNPLESEQLTENSTPVDSQSSAQVADIDMGG